MDKVCSIFLIDFLLPTVNDRKHFLRLFFCKWLQRIQSVAEFCQSNRNDRYTLQMWQICCHITNAPLQLLAVIDSFTEHDLPIHRDAAFIECLYLLQCIPRKPVVQHLTPQFRVRCMKGNINRLQMILYNPVNIMITHICQRDVISLQEGESGIIIFKIKCLSHSFRHLVDEAEHTFISAGTILVHQPLLKLDAQIFLIVLLNLQLPLFSVRLLDQKYKFFVIYKIMVIKNILYFLVIDTDQAVPRLHAKFPRNTSVLHGTDNMSMFHIVFS